MQYIFIQPFEIVKLLWQENTLISMVSSCELLDTEAALYKQ